MAVINLIAQEQQMRRQLERKTRMLGFGWLTVAGIIGAGWASLLLYGSSLNAQRAQVEAQLTQLRPTLQQLRQAQAQLGALQPLVETLQNAQKDTRRWLQLFQHFSQHTPAGVLPHRRGTRQARRPQKAAGDHAQGDCRNPTNRRRVHAPP
jgi:hypothetical protein